MSFARFLNLIDRTPIGAIVDKRLDIVEKTDPDRIYVQNIMAFYSLPYVAARTLCEIAVRQRIFGKKIVVFCPNDDCRRIIKSYDVDAEQDQTLTCQQCMLREEEQHTFSIENLHKETVYQLLQD